MLSALPFTELTMGLPLYRRIAPESAPGLAVSICSGTSHTAWMAGTRRLRASASSMSGRPAFTSRISAPASCCRTASLSKSAWFPSRSARFMAGFPVGLMRSPISAGARPPIATAREPDETTVARIGAMGSGAKPFSRSVMARKCAGVVPQQPPSSHAPARDASSSARAKASGVSLNTVRPLSDWGSPALGLMISGTSHDRRSAKRQGKSAWAPKPQFSPSAVTPRPESRAARAGMSAPVSSLPRPSTVAVASTGRPVSLAASTAALSSYVSLIVSIRIQSAPACAPASAASWKASYACSNGRSPSGASSLPLGPMSIAAKWGPGTPSRSASAIACFTSPTAARTTSGTVRPCPASLIRLAPNVFVLRMWQPASRYARWMARTRSGSERTARSGGVPAGRPAFCSSVPIAPSKNKSRLPKYL